jgi:1-acyl-sn-glycerol-3-phosphate acyltransferase
MSFINYIRAFSVLLIVVPISTVITCLWVIVGILFLRVSTSRVKAAPRWWSRTIARSFGVKVEVEGLENLEPEHPYILAANHQSQFDIFALDGFLMVDFRWMAKKELFRIPLVGWGMRLAGSIPIDRSHGREAMKSLAEAAERIASGTSVVIFPEGTRTRDGNLQPFKAGGMYLAIKSGVDVAPVALAGGYDVLPKGRFLPRPGRIMIRVGKPVSSKDFTQKQKHELADLLHDRVAALIAS